MIVIIAKWVTSTEFDSGNKTGVSSQGEPLTVDPIGVSCILCVPFLFLLI